MKVITLKQPWATLVAEGLKTYEFRSWKINYRGELLIHAGKGIDKVAMTRFEDFRFEYPQSQILAKVTIEDCLPLNPELNQKIINENSEIYGYNQFRTGYVWKLTNSEKIKSSEKIAGKQGIWNINDQIFYNNNNQS